MFFLFGICNCSDPLQPDVYAERSEIYHTYDKGYKKMLDNHTEVGTYLDNLCILYTTNKRARTVTSLLAKLTSLCTLNMFVVTGIVEED